ncbi:MAG: cytochrome B [Flavobacteriia bacterium]|nr:cytochrome B [Flavobacteriia bacterium]
MSGLIHIHSGLRWIALILLVIAIFNAVASKRKGEYLKKDKMINLFAMISLHTQLLIGIILMFTSGKVSFASGWIKNPMSRFYGMEHIAGMLIALVIITIGRKKAEKITAPIQKHSKIVTWYLIGLLIILASIPWPFRSALGGQWF